MAHKKGAGSTKNGRDSNAQRLGVKKFGGQAVRAGNIIEYDGKIWRVVKHNVVSPGKGSAFNQVEMRDARTGNKTNIKLRADETVEQLRADEKEMQYLFHEGDALIY